jgi:hypothetical protein
MFNTINDSKYQKYKNKYLTQKKIVGSGKVSFPKNLKVSVSKNLKDLKDSVPKDLKVSVPGLKTIGNTSKLTILAADSKVRGIVKDVSNDNLIKILGDPKIVGLIKKLINDNELIGSLKKHKLLNENEVLLTKLKETINSLE